MSNNNNIDIIPTEVEYIHDLFAYNKEFKTLICTSCRSAIKKNNIKSYINLQHKNYNDIEMITTILESSEDLEIKNPMCGTYGTGHPVL